jgi:hypothetical protein
VADPELRIPCHFETAEPIETKLCTVDNVEKFWEYDKYIHIMFSSDAPSMGVLSKFYLWFLRFTYTDEIGLWRITHEGLNNPAACSHESYVPFVGFLCKKLR